MYYKSTRNSDIKVESAVAITQGISEDGGLFVPESIPELTMDEIKYLSGLNYSCRAAYIFKKYLTDFTDAEIQYCTDNAYSTKNFETENIAEIAELFDGTYMLELWHGPTCAFKDMALQILPHLLTKSLKKKYDGKTVKYLAQVCQTPQAGKGAFVPGRFAMTCCVQDIQFVGMPCKYDDYKSLEQRSWINITAKVNVKYHPIYKGQTPDSTGPVLTAISVEPGEKPAQDVVMFS